MYKQINKYADLERIKIVSMQEIIANRRECHKLDNTKLDNKAPEKSKETRFMRGRKDRNGV